LGGVGARVLRPAAPPGDRGLGVWVVGRCGGSSAIEGPGGWTGCGRWLLVGWRGRRPSRGWPAGEVGRARGGRPVEEEDHP
jgi:hypothetical protein